MGDSNEEKKEETDVPTLMAIIGKLCILSVGKSLAASTHKSQRRPKETQWAPHRSRCVPLLVWSVSKQKTLGQDEPIRLPEEMKEQDLSDPSIASLILFRHCWVTLAGKLTAKTPTNYFFALCVMMFIPDYRSEK